MAGYSAGNLSVEFFGIDKSLSATLDNIIARIEKLEKTTNRFSKGSTSKAKNSKNTFGFLDMAKWHSVLYYGRKLGRIVGGLVDSGAEYTETLNLWETAMGNNITMATQFVDKMNQAYGISEKTLMNAQAIFKNMLGSLGQISDVMAYSLSEGITQMALDYASLYNVSFEQAFTKFQAALAGQVRPIRSVSGYDITENTLYQLYQTIGGTKTMRQLSRTEKQLLSILAIFNQMTASGAVGDLEKTMNSFANQSRVWSESLKEVKTWLGVIITYTLKESDIMIKLNAILITVARVLEAVAKRIGAIEHYESEPFESVTNSADNASKSIDDLNAKLLDFDKFRALNTSEESSGIGLDENLLNALSGYNTIMDNAINSARELSDEWLKALGFNIDANGELEFTEEQLVKAKNIIGSIIDFLGNFDGLELLKSLVPLTQLLLITLKEMLPSLVIIAKAFAPILTGLVNIIAGLVEGLDYMGLLKIAILGIIGLSLTTKVLSFAKTFDELSAKYIIPFFTKLLQHSKTTLPLATQGVTTLQYAMLDLSAAFMVGGLLALLNSEMSAGEKLTRVFIGLAAGIAAAAIAMAAFKQNWVQAVSVGALVAGGFFTVSALTYDNYAEGGLPDKGTLFRAGEAGAEIVYNNPSGQSGVVNVQQIEQAMYGALVRYGNSSNGKIELTVNLDGEKVYQNTTAHAKRRGNVWSKA